MIVRNYAKQSRGLFAGVTGNVTAMKSMQYAYYINYQGQLTQPVGKTY